MSPKAWTSVTSATTYDALPPFVRMVSVAFSSVSGSRAHNVTSAPKSARACAMPKPIPLLAPVTSARLPSSRKMLPAVIEPPLHKAHPGHHIAAPVYCTALHAQQILQACITENHKHQYAQQLRP